MEPGDIGLGELLSKDWASGIGDLRPNLSDGFCVAFADGSVRLIRRDVPREAISKFFTIESAKRFDRNQVLGPYTLDQLPALPLIEIRKSWDKR